MDGVADSWDLTPCQHSHLLKGLSPYVCQTLKHLVKELHEFEYQSPLVLEFLAYSTAFSYRLRYTAPNVRLIVITDWNGCVWQLLCPVLIYYPGIYVEDLRRTILVEIDGHRREIRSVTTKTLHRSFLLAPCHSCESRRFVPAAVARDLRVLLFSLYVDPPFWSYSSRLSLCTHACISPLPCSDLAVTG